MGRRFAKRPDRRGHFLCRPRDLSFRAWLRREGDAPRYFAYMMSLRPSPSAFAGVRPVGLVPPSSGVKCSPIKRAL